MDLNSITTVTTPLNRRELPPWTVGSAWLAGGTWLFSEPQPSLRTLIDLTTLGWPPIELEPDTLRLGATCTIAELEALEPAPDWRAGHLFAGCSQALLGSFKVWQTATVGGNVCLALPAAPMLALTVALHGVAEIWRPDGGWATMPMADFVLDAQRTALRPGELLRAIDLPLAALRRRAVMRQTSLTRHGRSGALLVATLEEGGGFALTITGSTRRPVRTEWTTFPAPDRVDQFVTALPADIWHDDVHGAPAWRRHMSRLLAAELLEELAA